LRLSADYYDESESVLTALLYHSPIQAVAMCHCFRSVDELNEQEREELVEEHSVDELRAEHSNEELQKLGVAA
jgi:hypothetical protein